MFMAKSSVLAFDLISFDVVGRALVAFRTKEAAERVSKKLDDGCLMVSNKRYIFNLHSRFFLVTNVEQA